MYTTETKQKALQFTLAGMSVTDICSKKDMPSRPTYYKWSSEGELTDGVPWPEYKERMEQDLILKTREKAMAQRAEKSTAFMDEMKRDLQEDVYSAIMLKIRTGDIKVGVGDLDTIARLYALLDNQAGEKMEFAAWFMRKIFAIAVEIMDERQFALFKTKASTLQHEVEVKMNPIDHSELPA